MKNVSKKNTIIVINGRKYDANTGAMLHGGPAAHTKPAPIKLAKPAVQRPGRQPAKHAAAHKPTPSRTLMRRAVQKPAANSKRRVKANTPLDRAAGQAGKSVVVKPAVTMLISSRLRRAKTIPKSRLISHFSSFSSGSSSHDQPAKLPAAPTVAQPIAAKRPTGKPKTTAELLEYALRQATSHEQLPVKSKRHSLFKRRSKTAVHA